MTAILFKAILASGLFLLAYKLLLEKEKMHQFNRFYLLFSLVLSFVIPFLVIEINVPAPVIFESTHINTEIANATLVSRPIAAIESSTNWSSILWTGYAVITFLLLVRFVVNLKAIRDKISNATVASFKNVKLVLLHEKTAPHSFLNYIFVSRDDYDERTIEEEILDHELAHAKQKHSLDILFVELVQIICWFNPFINLYKKAIQMNHEFLADEQVIRSNRNVDAYLQLLVSKASSQTRFPFMSSFNYLITKKRLIMMTTTTSNRIALAKQVASLLLFVCTTFFLSSKTYAQTKADPIATPSSSGSNMTKQDSAKKEKVIGQDNEFKKLHIFEQVDTNMWSVRKEPTINKPLEKISPTTSQLKLWSNPKVYGIWVDGNRMSNGGLNKYNANDFVWYEESLIKKNGKNYPQYNYDVNLMTNEYYEHYLKEHYLKSRKSSKKVIRGGSWKDVAYYLETGKRTYE